MKMPCLSRLKGEFFEEILFRLYILEEIVAETLAGPEEEVIRELKLKLQKGYDELGIGNAEASELMEMRVRNYKEDKRIYQLLRGYGDNKQEILSNLREHFRSCGRCRENYESFLEDEMIEGNLDVGGGAEYHDLCYYDKKCLGLYE